MSKQAHFINGQWILGEGQTFRSFDSATQKMLWEGQGALQQEINKAIEAAKAASDSWGNSDFGYREKFLKAYERTLASVKEPMALAISQENGKPLWEAKAEVETMLNKIDISIEAYKLRCPTTSKPYQQGSCVTRHRPHGVLAVFGPYNFPGHLPNGHIVPALLAGNTVLFKPSELTPYVAELIAECWQASGLPPGVFNLLQGDKETGKLLAAHPGIDGVLFTGSWATGLRLAEQMASVPYKILALEMGGNNPLVVSEIDDINAAVYATIQSAFITSGQRCTCARRLIVTSSETNKKFIESLIAAAKEIKVNSYDAQPEPFMGPLINVQAADKVYASYEQLLEKGGKPLLAMQRLAMGNQFLAPAIVDVTLAKDLEDEEIFGPLLQLTWVKDLSEAIKEANNTRYGLVAGLLSNSLEDYEEFFRHIKAGVVNWNMQTTGATSQAPFGGLGQSGNNRPSGYYAADYCAHPVASLEKAKVALPLKLSPGLGCF